MRTPSTMPAPTPLRFLAYNTHLFTGTFAGAGSWFSEQLRNGNKTEYEDRVRIPAIIQSVAARQPDIVALSEVWSNASKQAFISGLREVLPYSHSDNIVGLLGSGLLLLSRFPLSNPTFELFKGRSVLDRVASQKGFLLATVELDGTRFLVCATHTQAGDGPGDKKSRRSDIEQLRAALAARDPSCSMPAVVLGDLNVTGEQLDGAPTEEYASLADTMSQVQMMDAFRHPDSRSTEGLGFTYDGTQNALVRLFATEDSNARQRLDYIFTRKFRPTAVSVLSNFLYQSLQGSRMDLSDHYPLECVCTLSL